MATSRWIAGIVLALGGRRLIGLFKIKLMRALVAVLDNRKSSPARLYQIGAQLRLILAFLVDRKNTESLEESK
jgi:hypothetical protein